WARPRAARRGRGGSRVSLAPLDLAEHARLVLGHEGDAVGVAAAAEVEGEDGGRGLALVARRIGQVAPAAVAPLLARRVGEQVVVRVGPQRAGAQARERAAGRGGLVRADGLVGAHAYVARLELGREGGQRRARGDGGEERERRVEKVVPGAAAERTGE